MNLIPSIGLFSGLAFIGFVVAGLFYSRHTATARDLYRAVGLYLLAVMAQIINLCADVLNPEVGTTSIGLDVFNLAAMLAAGWFTDRRAVTAERRESNR